MTRNRHGMPTQTSYRARIFAFRKVGSHYVSMQQYLTVPRSVCVVGHAEHWGTSFLTSRRGWLCLILRSKMMFKESRPRRLTHSGGFPVRNSFPRKNKCGPGSSTIPRNALSLRWLNPNPIIDCRPDALPRFEVLLGGLNRDVAKQKLDLIQLPTRTPTEPSAGSSQIVGRECRNTCL